MANTSNEFFALVSQIQVAHDYRELLRQTVWHSQSRVDTLNLLGLGLANLMKKAWEDALVLSLARLLDPPASCGVPNLSARGVVKRLGLGDAARDAVEQIESQFKNIRDWRNKYISHMDLKVGMDQESVTFCWGQLDEMVEHLVKLVGDIQEANGSNRSTFDSSEIKRDVDALFTRLSVVNTAQSLAAATEAN